MKHIVLHLLLGNFLHGKDLIIKTPNKKILANVEDKNVGHDKVSGEDFWNPMCSTTQGPMKSRDIPLDGGNIRLSCTPRRGADRHRMKRQNMMVPCISIHKIMVGCSGKAPSVKAHKDLVRRRCSGRQSCTVTPTSKMFGVYCYGWRRMWISYSCDGGMDMTTAHIPRCTSSCPGETGVTYKVNSEITMKYGQVLATLPYIGKQFSISFELFINKFSSQPWQNVLHLTKGENAHEYGNRVPLVAVTPDKQLHVTSAISGGWNGGGNMKGLEQGRWIKVDITQTEMKSCGGTSVFEVFVDGWRKMMLENNKTETFKNIKVYASDPWHDPLNGKIRHLSIVS